MNTCHWTDQFAPAVYLLIIVGFVFWGGAAFFYYKEKYRKSKLTKRRYTHAEKRDFK